MSKLFPYLIVVMLISCSETQSKVSIKTEDNSKSVLPVSSLDTIEVQNEKTIETITGEEGETVTCYVLVADTGLFYYSLRDRMITLQDTLKQAIDTMGRTYNKAKNLIALPDDDEDDLYAGDYLPRRFPSQDMSLEYLSFYQEQAKEKNMAIVTGIYETKNSADSALSILKKVSPNAFVVKSDIYMGCIH